jgi:RNA polymerase sigma-B factor
VDATTQHADRRLFARLRADGRSVDREQAVRRYLPLARSLAHRYWHSGEPIEDLEQVACIGLLNAIDRFDPELGTRFSSFAVPTILGELRQHFRDHTWVLRAPQRLQTLSVRIEHARDDLVPSLGRQPTVAELSDRLCAAQELILQALEIAVARNTIPLDGPWSADGEGPQEQRSGRDDDDYARAEDRVLLVSLLRTLNPQDAEIVLLRFREELTQDAIARRVGVSQMQVSRVLCRSMGYMRDAALGRPDVTPSADEASGVTRSWDVNVQNL